jgi:inhibitor of cysteine peptidase
MRKKLIISGIVFIFFIVVLSGCTEKIIQGSGTIQFNDFEGGFYGIVGDDGENYDPINLPLEFEEDGIRIKYTLKILEDQVSIHQWGTMVEIITIEKI